MKIQKLEAQLDRINADMKIATTNSAMVRLMNRKSVLRRAIDNAYQAEVHNA